MESDINSVNHKQFVQYFVLLTGPQPPSCCWASPQLPSLPPPAAEALCPRAPRLPPPGQEDAEPRWERWKSSLSKGTTDRTAWWLQELREGFSENTCLYLCFKFTVSVGGLRSDTLSFTHKNSWFIPHQPIGRENSSSSTAIGWRSSRKERKQGQKREFRTFKMYLFRLFFWMTRGFFSKSSDFRLCLAFLYDIQLLFKINFTNFIKHYKSLQLFSINI